MSVEESFSRTQAFSRAQSLIVDELTTDKLQEFLIQNPECANAIVRHETLLFLAIRKSPSKASTLINRMSAEALDHANDLGRTALHVAALYSNLEVIKMLLHKMSVQCVSKPDLQSCTALHHVLHYENGHRSPPLVRKMIRKMDCRSFNVEDTNHMTVLDHLLNSNRVYDSETSWVEAKMSLDTVCRVYLRQKDDKCHKRARYLLAESLSSLVAYLHADVVTVVQEYIVDETRVCRKRVQ